MISADRAESQGWVDARAFHHRHHRDLLGYLVRRATSRVVAEDLTQETWVGFFRAQGWLTAEPVALLYAIAHRRLVDWYRHAGRMPATYPLGDDVGAVLFTYVAVGADDSFAIDLRTDVARALRELTQRQRQAVLMTYFDGLDRRSVAEVMGVTADGVKALLKAALKRLRLSSSLELYGRPTEGVHR